MGGILIDWMATPRFKGSIDDFMAVCNILKKSCTNDKILRIDTVPLPEHRAARVKTTDAVFKPTDDMPHKIGMFHIEGRDFTLEEFKEFLWKVQQSYKKLMELGLIETIPPDLRDWVPPHPRPSPLGFAIYVRGK